MRLRSRLQVSSPKPRLQRLQLQNAEYSRRLNSAMGALLRNSRQRLGHLAQVLDSLSPLGVLQRGYGIVSDKDGAVLTDATQVQVGDLVEARLARGNLGLVVARVEPEPD